MLRPDWIAVDWGTSSLRAWAMSGDTVLGSGGSDRGMGTLAPDQFEAALLEVTGGWLPARAAVPVIACGMVGAKAGWAEAGYRRVPVAPVGGAMTQAPCADARHRVFIIGGLSQAEPPDVMRGEETQIAGFLLSAPDFDGTLCLPGTHTKWVRIADGQVRRFRTVMTGELFATLSRHTVLRLTVGTEGWDDAAFSAALQEMLAAPERLTAALFGLRSGALVAGLGPEAARARLSGLLIGAELAATRDYWDGSDVRILGDARLAGLYGDALAAGCANARKLDAQSLTLDGLRAAWRRMREGQDDVT